MSNIESLKKYISNKPDNATHIDDGGFYWDLSGSYPRYFGIKGWVDNISLTNEYLRCLDDITEIVSLLMNKEK